MTRTVAAITALLLLVVTLVSASAFDDGRWVVASWTLTDDPHGPVDSTIVTIITGPTGQTHRFGGAVTVDSFDVGPTGANATRSFRVQVSTKRLMGGVWSTSPVLDSLFSYTNVVVAPPKPGPFTQLEVR